MSQVDDRVLANQLGDLTVMADPPAKMLKALAAISARAHPAYDECSDTVRGASKDKCLFMSLAVRDFLVGIGFDDATVRSCFLYISAEDSQGEQIWSVGLGAPGQQSLPEKFNGHAVCTVPSLSLLIDTTIYQAIRPHWREAISVDGRDEISRAVGQSRHAHGCPSIAGAEIELPGSAS